MIRYVFFSIQYHIQHADYTQSKLKNTSLNHKIKILLVLVDTENSAKALLQINKLCFVYNFSLILSWSDLECARLGNSQLITLKMTNTWKQYRYLETYKEYELKSSVAIQEKVETEFVPRVTKVLTSVKSINKTDVRCKMRMLIEIIFIKS